MSPILERRAVDKGEEGAASSTPLHVPAGVAPGSAPEASQVPAANDANDSEPPKQMDVGVLSFLGKSTIIQATVDHSVPLNVVTKKCLKKLGFQTLRHDLPPNLSKLAAKALPGHCGWEQLTLCTPTGHRALSRDIDFLVVGDDYGCDMLLGRETKGINFKSGSGIYPNYLRPRSKG